MDFIEDMQELDLLIEDILILVDRAEKKKHLNIQRIENLQDYRQAKVELKRTKIFEQCFHKASKTLFNEYIQSLFLNKRQPSLLIDANKLDSYAEFYKEEALMWQVSIDEYLSYLGTGHAIDAFLGKDRED